MKAVCLISGGIDSPVAAQIALMSGFQLFLLHYHNYPFHSLGTLEKVVTLSNIFLERNPGQNISLSIIPHGKSQEMILNHLEGRTIRQTCLFCRIQMFSKAEVYAKQIKADIIVTGEILGEQASQTLNNLPIVTSKVNTPVVRPLVGYNKKEVVQLSKKWGFYSSSILPGGCCSINPKYPETKGQLKIVDPIFNQMTDSLKTNALVELNDQLTFSLPVDINEVLDKFEI
ncbi:MAG: 7-cyano-7-deazaguanine synthase [Candidatus Hodarchaeales archaeon]